jgi:hypothetical protein
MPLGAVQVIDPAPVNVTIVYMPLVVVVAVVEPVLNPWYCCIVVVEVETDVTVVDEVDVVDDEDVTELVEVDVVDVDVEVKQATTHDAGSVVLPATVVDCCMALVTTAFESCHSENA